MILYCKACGFYFSTLVRLTSFSTIYFADKLVKYVFLQTSGKILIPLVAHVLDTHTHCTHTYYLSNGCIQTLK